MERGMLWAMEIQRLLCIHLIQQMRISLKQLRELANSKGDIEDKRSELQRLLVITEISSAEVQSDLSL